MQIDLFVFDRLPQPLDEDVVAPRTASIHADADFVSLQHIDEACGGKLRALVGVEDLRRTVAADGFLERFDAEVRRHAVGDPPAQNPPAEPVEDREIHKATRHRDIGHIGRPDLIGSIDGELSQQVRIDRMSRMSPARVRTPVNRALSHGR